MAFLSYCLHVTLRKKLQSLAAGLTPRAVLDKFAAIQMVDVHFPTTDGRKLIFRRYTKPEPRSGAVATAAETRAATAGSTTNHIGQKADSALSGLRAHSLETPGLISNELPTGDPASREGRASWRGLIARLRGSPLAALFGADQENSAPFSAFS